MYAKLWSRSDGRYAGVVVALVRAEGGVLTIEEMEPMPPKQREYIEHMHREKKGDEVFLKALAFDMRGSYNWAELVTD